MRSFTRIFTVLFLVLAVVGCNEQDDTLNPAAADNASMQKKPTTTTNGPVINSVNKSSAIIGDEIVITGENFGPRYKYATNYVMICGVKARVYSLWSKTEIHVTVPSGSIDPDDELTVTVNDVASAGVPFEILWPGEVIIGDQTWSGTNLDVDHFKNNDQIQKISSQAEYDAWVNAGADTPAWCYYNFDEDMGKRYGKLYNWYAVTDSRGLAPNGWHIPTDEEWSDLAYELGARSPSPYDAIGYFGTDEGGKLKEVGNSSWSTPNEGATNSSGFTALPGGYLTYLGNFGGFVFYSNTPFGLWSLYWTSTIHDTDPTQSWIRGLDKNEARLYRNYGKHGNFMSVRLIKNQP